MAHDVGIASGLGERLFPGLPDCERFFSLLSL